MAGFALFAATRAAAQISVQAELQSDDRYRGVSLSNGAPALGLTLTYDSPSGLYVGVNGAAGLGREALNYTAYVGYAQRMGDNAWDVGLTGAGAVLRPPGRYAPIYKDVYVEVYAGFTHRNLSVHVYYSPRYIVEDAPTIYVDLDAAIHPAAHWRVFGHAGVLTPLSSWRPDAGGARVDGKLGLAREFRHGEVDLAVSAITPAPFYPEGYRQNPDAVTAAVLYFF
jgi:uncharacterized protein (TIGR02001 family)